jgi:hypothetical protein
MGQIALLLALALCAALVPDAASACSVCYAGAEESRKAFLLTTVLLSMLPLAMFGSLFWWLRRRFRELGQTEVDAIGNIAIPLGVGAEPIARSTRKD